MKGQSICHQPNYEIKLLERGSSAVAGRRKPNWMQGAQWKGGIAVKRSAGLIKGPLSNLGHGLISKILLLVEVQAWTRRMRMVDI